MAMIRSYAEISSGLFRSSLGWGCNHCDRRDEETGQQDKQEKPKHWYFILRNGVIAIHSQPYLTPVEDR